MRAKILVVDDMPEIRSFMWTILGSAGYEVSTAATFEEAKQILDRETPDLVLLDIRLGAYNGLQLAVKIRAEHPTHPIVMMSGYVDPVLIEEARRQGAEFIEKPVDPAHLLELVGRMLARSSPDRQM